MRAHRMSWLGNVSRFSSRSTWRSSTPSSRTFWTQTRMKVWTTVKTESLFICTWHIVTSFTLKSQPRFILSLCVDLGRMYNLVSRITDGLGELKKLLETHIYNQGLAAIEKCGESALNVSLFGLCCKSSCSRSDLSDNTCFNRYEFCDVLLGPQNVRADNSGCPQEVQCPGDVSVQQWCWFCGCSWQGLAIFSVLFSQYWISSSNFMFNLI